MTIQEQRLPVFESNGEALRGRVATYAASELFGGQPDPLHGPNPYRRTLVPEALAELDFDRPLAAREFATSRSLTAHRILGTYYESETVLLPDQGLAGLRTDFATFYGEDLRRIRESSLSDLERFAFGFLDSEVEVSGDCTAEVLDTYLRHLVDEAANGESAALNAVAGAVNRPMAADTYLVQLALDGLTEASAMSRNLGGAYGPEQSALFKVFIDEFGYGAYEAKHTTIFTKMLRSRGMASHVHAYWNFYLPGPIAINNHYYLLSRDHSKFFRYAGAVAYAEAVFAPAFVKMIKVFRDVFGDDVDLHYCDEHAHIDEHHGRITREEILLALAERHGDHVVPELMRGIAEARLLGGWFEDDTAAQIEWADTIPAHRERAAGRTLEGPPERVERTRKAMFSTRNHDRDMVLEIEHGEAELVTSATGTPEPLAKGDAVLVPAGRVYGVRSVSDSSVHLLHPVRDDS
ncbi:iron-containing redox enzyme family protein [Actinomadura harenae]|uniref:Iron-containing redox enzyme family protein n=1 Tax=Actinomadura harenae TaxID=2483351 RepID=A0A3M2MD24_9ACTN|nr:iron-containing redox enzyme family protein [Actinomadura harenae]RMI47442.1 iron-containing redox enzyme family protein [Actinomadura harenae]